MNFYLNFYRKISVSFSSRCIRRCEARIKN